MNYNRLESKWYNKGRQTLYNIAYTYTVYSIQYASVVSLHKKYMHKFGARRAKYFMRGMLSEIDVFTDMERDYYGR